MPIMKVDAQGYKREKDNSSYFLLQYSDKQSSKSALFTQPHEKTVTKIVTASFLAWTS